MLRWILWSRREKVDLVLKTNRRYWKNNKEHPLAVWDHQSKFYQYSLKNYMIDIFHFLRLLNPIFVIIFQKTFIFWQEFEVWCSHYSSNLTSVVTKWWHEFSKKSGILQLKKMRPFGGICLWLDALLFGWWDWSKECWQFCFFSQSKELTNWCKAVRAHHTCDCGDFPWRGVG